MSKSRLLFLIVLAFVPATGLADDYPPGTPDDIKAIFEKMKHGHMPTKAEQTRIMDWQKGMAAKVGVTPQTGPVRPDGIPVRVEATIRWKSNEASGESTAWTDEQLFATIDGTDDYNIKLADPSSHLSTLRFEPAGPPGQPVMTGGGSYTIEQPGHKITAKYEHVMGGMMLATSGHDDLLFPLTGGIGGEANGKECDVNNGCHDYHHAANDNFEGIHFPFAQEKHQWDVHEAVNGKPTPKPTMELHLQQFKDAIAKGGQQTISASENFSWHDGNVTASGFVTLKITIRPKPLELVIDEPVDYAKWTPIPVPTDPALKTLFEKGTRLTFHVHLEAKDKSTAVPVTPLEFHLRDVSTGKGIAGNYPKNGDTSPDLVFSSAPGTNQAIQIDRRDPTHATLKGPGTEAYVTVEATDTGAYGKLTAEAPALGLDGIDKRTEKYGVKVPQDDDGNHIADAWTDRFGFAGYPETWDEEAVPAQMRNKGDSLTLYEEYRGFVLLDDAGNKKWMRLEPDVDGVKRRKTFVLQKTGHADWIKEAVARFQQISSIRVYFVPNDNSGTERGPSDDVMNWLNFNSEASSTRAFVIRIEDRWAEYVCPGSTGQRIYGQTIRADADCGKVPEGPWKLKVIYLYPKIMQQYLAEMAQVFEGMTTGNMKSRGVQTQLYLLNATMQELVDSAKNNSAELFHELYVFSAFHEMFHSVGAYHHGGEGLLDFYDEDTGTTPSGIKEQAENCPLFYWATYYGVEFFLRRFDPSKTAWVTNKNHTDAGHPEVWALCDRENWPQVELKP